MSTPTHSQPSETAKQKRSANSDDSSRLPSDMKTKTTPAHFLSSWHFMRYILELALRDRENYLDAITPRFFHKPDDDQQKDMDETKAEIASLQQRIKNHERKTK